MEGEALDTAKLSFREQKAAELRAQWAANEKTAESEPEEVTEEEGSEDVVDDSAEDIEVEASTEESEPDQVTEDDGAEETADEVDYKAKYETLEKEHSRFTANRRQIEEDFAHSQEQFVHMRHEMDDTLTQVRQGSEFYANLAMQELQQLQGVNPAQLPAEQQSGYYQQLNQATQRAQHLKGLYDRGLEYEKGEREKLKKREAEVSIAVLKSRIPEWSNDVYSELGELAGEFQMSREEFTEETRAPIMLMLNEIRKFRNAEKAVTKTVKQRKAKAPRSRSGAPANRNAKGEFVKAKKDFKPNTRGSFAQMKAAEYRMKEEGR